MTLIKPEGKAPVVEYRYRKEEFHSAAETEHSSTFSVHVDSA